MAGAVDSAGAVTRALAPSEYYEILMRYMVPMFPGATLEPSPIAVAGSSFVSQETREKVLVRPDRNWPQTFRLTRVTGFRPDDIRLLKQFVEALREKLVAADQPFFPFLVDRCPEDVVSRSVAHKEFGDDLIPSVIGLLRKWAIETYEGRPIVAAIGIEPNPNPSKISDVHVSSFQGASYAKVLSNGLDTLIVLSPSGHVVEHRSLQPQPDNTPSSEHPFAPRRHVPMAAWATAGRVAFALNRQGEILVFRNRQLKFAFRAGLWSHFAHSAMLARLGKWVEPRRAVYASCLDVSFARTGGLIAVTRSVSRSLSFVNESDLLEAPASAKSVLLRHLVGRPFAALPRAVREELTALDGATVLDRKGTVVAAGAIVKVPGGSDGGGRLAAAKALSRLGLAIKVSSDGGISAFSDRGPINNPEILFRVCV
jgi:hypothetical protein